MYYKCVKFHKNPISGLEGVALTRYMDGRSDRVIPIYPPQTLFAGGIVITCKPKTTMFSVFVADLENALKEYPIHKFRAECSMPIHVL